MEHSREVIFVYLNDIIQVRVVLHEQVDKAFCAALVTLTECQITLTVNDFTAHS